VPQLSFELDTAIQRESSLLETIRLANANLASAPPTTDATSSD
jgi:hypothetical protein